MFATFQRTFGNSRLLPKEQKIDFLAKPLSKKDLFGVSNLGTDSIAKRQLHIQELMAYPNGQIPSRIQSFLSSLKIPLYMMDVETTGLSPRADKVVQIGFCRLNHLGNIDFLRLSQFNKEFATTDHAKRLASEPVLRHNFIYADEKELCLEKEAVHHIRYEDVEHAPRIEEVLPEISRFLKIYYDPQNKQFAFPGALCAHNLSFDLRFMNEQYINHLVMKFPEPQYTIDTLALARKIFKTPKQHEREKKNALDSQRKCLEDCKLGTLLHYYFPESKETLHDAEADVVAALKIFLAMIEHEKHVPYHLSELHVFLAKKIKTKPFKDHPPLKPLGIIKTKMKKQKNNFLSTQKN